MTPEATRPVISLMLAVPDAPVAADWQGGFFDPFGHLWLVGDKSPLHPFRG